MTFKGHHVLKQTELLYLQLRLSIIFHCLAVLLQVAHFSFHFSFHCFWKLSRSCCITLNSSVITSDIFSLLPQLEFVFEDTYSLPEFEEGSTNVRGGFWHRKKSFCCPFRNAFRFSQVVIPWWCWWVLSGGFVSWAHWTSTALLTPASRHSLLPPVIPLCPAAPSGAQGTRMRDWPMLKRERMLAKQPNSELPANHSLKSWVFCFMV